MLMPDLATIAMLVLSLALAHGATARVARLIYDDDITEPLRAKVIRKLGYNHLLVKWMKCPWCCGFWVALLITTPIAWFPIMGLRFWWVFGLAVWSVAHAAGRLNHNHEPTRK
jgi:hypothetical protein